MSFPRYAKYKDSGVEWLPAIPAGWRLEPLKWHLTQSDGGVWGNDPTGNDDVVVLRSTEQTVDGRWQIESPALRSLSDAERREGLLREGDLLLTKSSGSSLHIGKTTLVTHEVASMQGCYSNFMQRLRLRTSLEPRLAWYLLNNEIVRRQFDVLSNSTTGLANLNGTIIGQVLVPLPSTPDQLRIVNFLDHETAKIDELVAEQERLIDLLKEKRQAVISHAVTKGLNPAAPMKDSGIEWLGAIPAHWEIGPVKRFLASLDGRRVPLSGEERSAKAGEFPYYGASGVIDWIDEYIFDEDLVLVSEDGANLLNRSTPIAFVARGKYWVNNHAHILRAPDGHVAFWAEAIEHIDLTPIVTGSAQPKLTADALFNLRIAVPPLDSERAAIEAYIAKEDVKLTKLMNEAQRGIELLQERRAALITAAVTGQIDVREAAARSAA